MNLNSINLLNDASAPGNISVLEPCTISILVKVDKKLKQKKLQKIIYSKKIIAAYFIMESSLLVSLKGKEFRGFFKIQNSLFSYYSS